MPARLRPRVNVLYGAPVPDRIPAIRALQTRRRLVF